METYFGLIILIIFTKNATDHWNYASNTTRYPVHDICIGKYIICFQLKNSVLTHNCKMKAVGPTVIAQSVFHSNTQRRLICFHLGQKFAPLTNCSWWPYITTPSFWFSRRMNHLRRSLNYLTLYFILYLTNPLPMSTFLCNVLSAFVS